MYYALGIHKLCVRESINHALGPDRLARLWPGPIPVPSQTQPQFLHRRNYGEYHKRNTYYFLHELKYSDSSNGKS